MNFKKILKTPIFITGLILVLLFLLFNFFDSNKEENKNFEIVIRKDITEKVAASGQVTPLKKIDLQFETQGRVEQVKVNTGQEISLNDTLITLENKNTEFDVLSAQAAKKIAQANLDQVLSGATSEEIKVYKSSVKKAEADINNYQNSIKNAEISLENTKESSRANIRSSYEDALNTLSDSYIKAFNAYRVVEDLQRDYFQSNSQEGLKVKQNKNYFKKDLEDLDYYLSLAESENYSDIDTALKNFKNLLNQVKEELKNIRDVVEKPPYRDSVSSSDQTSLKNQQSYIITALSNVVDAQQDISSTKNTNQSNIDSAKTTLDSAKSSLESAEANLEYNQNKLNELKAKAQDYEINLYEGKLEQAIASLGQAQENYNKTILKSPCNGIVADLDIEEGEIAKSTDIVSSLICQNSYQIEAEIPEADIGKVDLKDKVSISLDAFPDKEFTGFVNEIDPAETTIQGVVYYKIKIVFNEFDSRIKPGMTTDIDIITNQKEDTLTIPQRLIIRKNDQEVVKVLEGEKTKEKVIQTGITNNQGEIEIISGLEEGDKIVR